jgi:predicted MFS family arabinose efflux permease
MSKSALKATAVILAVVLIIAALLVVFYKRDLLTENPFELSRAFYSPSHAITATDGSLLVTDMGKTRVTLVNPAGEAVATVFGSKNREGFFYAEHIAYDVETKRIFVADVKYGLGTRVASEAILSYSMNGDFEGIMFKRFYSDGEKPLQFGNILDMRVYNGVLSFIMADNDVIKLYSFNTNNEPVLQREIGITNSPFLANAVYDALSDKLYAVSKNGMIYEEIDSTMQLLSDMSDSGDIPWEIASCGERHYITNLADPGLINAKGERLIDTEGIIFRLDINDSQTITFTDNESVFQAAMTGEIISETDTVEYSTKYFTFRMFVWFLALLAGLALIFGFIRLAAWLIKVSGGSQTKYLAVIIAAILLTSTIVIFSLLTASISESQRKNEYNLIQTALLISTMSSGTIGDDLQEITELGHYGGEEFLRIRGKLDPIAESAAEQGEYLYYILFKNYDGVLCGVIDYEDTVGVIFPYYEYCEYFEALMNGEFPYMFDIASDAFGSWLFAFAPVFNSAGEAVGIVEVGSNLDIETQRINDQIRDAVLSTVVLLVLFLLVFVEITALIEIYDDRKKRLQLLDAGEKHIPELIRPLTFLAFLADNTCTVFLPHLSGTLFESSALKSMNMAPSVAAALPISVKLMFLAIAAIIGGNLISKLGMKTVLTVGVITEIIGMLFAAFAVYSQSYEMLLAASAVIGCGLGLIVVAGNTIPSYSDSEERRNHIFAGVNVGIVSGVVVGISIGAYAAQYLGYSLAFVIAGAAMLPALIFAVKCSPPKIAAKIEKAVKSAKKAAKETAEKAGISFGRFIAQKSVFSFLIFAMLPFAVIMYFKEYTFPLFAFEYGYTEVEIGQVLLFAGAISILITAPLAELLLKVIGSKGVNILAGALNAAGLLLFAYFPSIESASIAVLILTSAGCLGLVAQGVYFSSIKASEKYGVGKSMGFFSLFDNLANTAGPLLFAALLIMGFSESTRIIGFVSIPMLLVFVLLGQSDKKTIEKPPENSITKEKQEIAL